MPYPPHDLAVIAVPATAVLATLADAADAGIPAAVVISSGFEELGEEGADSGRHTHSHDVLRVYPYQPIGGGRR